MNSFIEHAKIVKEDEKEEEEEERTLAAIPEHLNLEAHSRPTELDDDPRYAELRKKERTSEFYDNLDCLCCNSGDAHDPDCNRERLTLLKHLDRPKYVPTCTCPAKACYAPSCAPHFFSEEFCPCEECFTWRILNTFV